MKVKKFQSKQLLKLHLLKSRVYESPIKKMNFNDLKSTNLDQILVGVKKALQIIFQYNKANKCILFIGLPTRLELKINSLTRHIAVPSNFDIQGIISNTKTGLLLDIKNSTQNLIQRDSLSLSPKLAKKFDLVVLFDHDKNYAVLSEAWSARIPTITFASSTNSANSVASNAYLINGNFKNILTAFDKNIFFVGLNFLFKNLRKQNLRSLSVLPTTKKQIKN